MTSKTTFETWLKEEKFKAQVILPFKEYLKEAFRERCYLCIRCHYLLSVADDSAAKKAMARDQGTPPSSSVQGSSSADNNVASSQSTAEKRRASACPEGLPPSDPANENLVGNSTSTSASDEQKKLAWRWLSELNTKSYNQRRPDSEDDDDADYRAENEDDDEIGASATLRAKSARIGKRQLEQAKLTREYV